MRGPHILALALLAGCVTQATGKGRDRRLPPVITQKYPAWTFTGSAILAWPASSKQKAGYAVAVGVERMPVYFKVDPELELTAGSHEGDIGIAVEYGVMGGPDLGGGWMVDGRLGVGVGLRDRATLLVLMTGGGLDQFHAKYLPPGIHDATIVPLGGYTYVGARLVTGISPTLAVRLDGEVAMRQDDRSEWRVGGRVLSLWRGHKLEAGLTHVSYPGLGSLTVGTVGFSF